MTPAITLLKRLGVAHELVSYEHDAAARSYGEEAADLLGLDPTTVFKTLMACLTGGRRDNELVIALVPVSGTLDLKALARSAQAKKASMADVEVAERTSGYVAGGISPFGQKTVLRTFLDESALAVEKIHVSGGRRGLEIIIDPNDLLRVLNGRAHPLMAQASP